MRQMGQPARRVGQHGEQDMPPHVFEALDSRISTTHGLCCVEPPGQDGYNCLLLAAIC